MAASYRVFVEEDALLRWFSVLSIVNVEIIKELISLDPPHC